MGNSRENALKSYLEHLLKLPYWELEKERYIREWKAEIKIFREQIKKHT